MLIIGLQAEQEAEKTTVVHQIMNELPERRSRYYFSRFYYRENHNLSLTKGPYQF
jgi:uridine kinase